MNEVREISSSDKSAIVSELKSMPLDDVVATHRRLHQWAAQGNILSGFTKQDMEWLHSAVEAELRRRAEEDGRDPPEPSPLEWGRSGGEPDEEQNWLPATVGKIIAKAKKKKSGLIPDDLEVRAFPLRELRAVGGEDEPARIEGYAAVFNSFSDDLGGFREKIQPGAFKKTLAEQDVRALWNHDPNFVFGRTKSGTLTLAEDEVGLRFVIRPPETQWARDHLVTIRRGDVDQMSFMFRSVKDKFDRSADDEVIRTVYEVKLFDISIVTFPAYPQTSAQVRSNLQSFLISEPGAGVHSDLAAEGARARARLAILRRRLDLFEKS